MLALAIDGQHRTSDAAEAFQGMVAGCSDFVPGLERAAAFFYREHRPEAVPLLRQTLVRQPSNQTAHAMLGAELYREGDCAGAVEQYQAAPDAMAASAPAIGEEAACLVRLHRSAEATTLLAEAVKHTGAAAPRRMLSELLNAAGRSEDALKTLEPLLGAGSRDDKALVLASRAQEALHRTPEAVEALRRAIMLQPTHVENYLEFARLCFEHGSFDVGMDFLQRGLTQVPGDARLLLARGVMEAQTGKLDQALADFESAHRSNPRLSFAEDAMGMLLSQKHDDPAALAFFAAHVKATPDDALLQYLYGEALAAKEGASPEDEQAAIGALRHAIEVDPGYAPPYGLLCTLLVRQGDYTGAEAMGEKALQLDPDDETVLYQELMAARRLKHADDVARWVKRLAEAKQHHAAAGTSYTLTEQTSQIQ